MKRFFKSATVFLFLMLSCSLFIHYYLIPELNLTPYYWGDKLITEKRNAVIRQQPEVIFFGSSMVYRQINPAVFDAVVKENTGKEMHSFNYGVNWLASSELIHLSDQVINELTKKPNYVFLELQRIKMVDYKNYLTTRIIYWYTPKMYAFTAKAILNSRMPLYSKIGQLISHTVNFTGNQINLGYFTEALRFRAESVNPEFYRRPEETGNGFLSLEEENSKLFAAGVNPERLNRFLKDTSAVTSRKQASITAFIHFDKNPDDLKIFNSAYVQKLHLMIEEYRKQNIHLILFLPPRLDRLQYKELLPIFYALPEKNRINLADAQRYPEFYLAANSFDVTHMNEKGAALYSKALAENFVKLLQAE